MSSSASSQKDGSSKSQPIVIAGAGLAGCMCALLLSRRLPQTEIILLEAREDFRIADRQDEEGEHGARLKNAVKRSINLALSHRGISALKAAGL